MSLEDTELNINGTSFKGVYIAIVMGIGSTIGGGVWTASSLYSRLEAVEAIEVPDVAPLNEQLIKLGKDAETDRQNIRQSVNADIELIKQELINNDVSQLQGKLATLGTNLVTIRTQQEELLEINKRVIELDRELQAMKATVTKAELITENVKGYDKKMQRIQNEIEDLWKGLDYLANPLN